MVADAVVVVVLVAVGRGVDVVVGNGSASVGGAGVAVAAVTVVDVIGIIPVGASVTWFRTLPTAAGATNNGNGAVARPGVQQTPFVPSKSRPRTTAMTAATEEW